MPEFPWIHSDMRGETAISPPTQRRRFDGGFALCHEHNKRNMRRRDVDHREMVPLYD